MHAFLLGLVNEFVFVKVRLFFVITGISLFVPFLFSFLPSKVS